MNSSRQRVPMVIITLAACFAVFTTSAGANSVQLQQVSLTIQPQSPVLPVTFTPKTGPD